MSEHCPKGYYWDGSKCKKSITIKRKGIYGKGFESEPQSEQYAKIRKEEKIEGGPLVVKQMAALNAFSHSQGSAHKDLEYATKLDHESGHGRCSTCGQPIERVHTRNGTYLRHKRKSDHRARE